MPARMPERTGSALSVGEFQGERKVGTADDKGERHHILSTSTG